MTFLYIAQCDYLSQSDFFSYFKFTQHSSVLFFNRKRFPTVPGVLSIDCFAGIWVTEPFILVVNALENRFAQTFQKLHNSNTFIEPKKYIMWPFTRHITVTSSNDALLLLFSEGFCALLFRMLHENTCGCDKGVKSEG